MHATLQLLRTTDFPAIRRRAIDTLQVNLGYRCNQSCVHCHVNAGPNRTEKMSRETVADCARLSSTPPGSRTLDLTGGAPELNPNFRRLVMRARGLGVHVIDRCNLTILEEPGQEDLAEFLAAQRVEIVASLPCYLEDNVDRQRGKGVFRREHPRPAGGSMRSATGARTSGLTLNLVYNPQGREPAAGASRAGVGLQAPPGRALRHRLQSPVHPGQHADPALRQHAGFQGPVQRLHEPLRESRTATKISTR